MSYWNRYLYMDISDRKTDVFWVDQKITDRYLGGNGIGAYLMYTLTKSGVDPLSPENIIIINTGPANGTLIPMSSKFAVISKSPQTNTFTKGFCGGEFGHKLKYAGWDGLIIKGAADRWTHIHIEDDRVWFLDADYLKGLYTTKTQHTLKKKFGDDIGQLVIGPAGENLVKYACILSDLRAVGTGGMGAVLGSKKIKAITVRGTKVLKPKNIDRLLSFTVNFQNKVFEHPGILNLSYFGTAAGVLHLNHLSILPSYNWQRETFELASDISGEALREKVIKDVSCAGCIVPCGKYSVSKETFTVGPEYEGIYSMGSLIGNGDIDELISLDRLTDELGLGQIQAGGVVAWLMECYEKGLIDRKQVDGLDARFGNTYAVREILRKIAFREGIGDILAEGSERASTLLETGKDFVMTVKGMEIAGHSPRGVKTQALGYAVSNRGPVHCDIRPGMEENSIVPLGSPADKGKVGKELAVWSSIANSIIYCLSAEKVIGFSLNETVVEMINAVMDWQKSVEDITQIGERVYTIERMFNLREGFTRKDDTLPKRIMTEKSDSGYLTTEDELSQMVKEFYLSFGWDEEGVPTVETLRRLSIDLQEGQR